MTTPESPTPPRWEEIARDPDFRRLLLSKIKFVVPATLFFVAYYFALPVLVAYAPDLMNRPVLGKVNAAYLFALSQFFVAWALAGLYVWVAAGWDRRSDAIVKKYHLK